MIWTNHLWAFANLASNYRPTHHQFDHHNPQTIPNVSHIPSSSAGHRRDSSVGLALGHTQGPGQFPHPSHSPTIRQSPHSNHLHHSQQPVQTMSSRPRSTTVATVEPTGSSSAAMLHSARPRAHSYADPRAAAEDRIKHSQTPSLDGVVFPPQSMVPEMDEEPLYVNAKQYHRILKRRVARARLAEMQKLSTQRKVRALYPRILVRFPRTASDDLCIYPTALPASIKAQSCR
jgi:hypothetical protein